MSAPLSKELRAEHGVSRTLSLEIEAVEDEARATRRREGGGARAAGLTLSSRLVLAGSLASHPQG